LGGERRQSGSLSEEKDEVKKTLFRLKHLVPMAYHLARWHYRFYVRKKSFPVVCGVYLTNKCNLQCAMCSIWADKKKSTLTLDQVKTLVDAVTPGLCYLSFSGGEPLLVGNLLDMVAYASERVPYTHLVTNGMLMDDAIARELSRAGLKEISISLDGDRDWHNALRNSPKSFDAALGAIESLKRAAPDIDIVVNTVIFPNQPEQAARAVALTEKLGVAHKVQPVSKHYSFEASPAGSYKIDFNATDETLLKALVRSLSKNPRIVNSRFYLNKIPDYFKQRLQNPLIREGCLSPHVFLEVSSYGRASPCLYFSSWKGPLEINADLKRNMASPEYHNEKKKMERCRLCNETMYICYWEPMVTFPLSHFIKYTLFRQTGSS
jgi:MoaA/NifB/PqqE/SkfB family radical SAM enzyme